MKKRCSVRKDALRNFAIFTGKHLCQGLFFNIKGFFRFFLVFSIEFWEISVNTFFIEHLLENAS